MKYCGAQGTEGRADSVSDCRTTQAARESTVKKWQTQLLVVLVTAVLGSGSVAAAPLYSVVDLGTLGGTYGHGAVINASGQVTGAARTDGDAAEHAFLWNGTSMLDLGTLGGTYSAGTGINASGQVTGWASTDGDAAYHAFLWKWRRIANDLGTLGGTSSYGAGINASGQVTGAARTDGDAAEHAFLWNGTSMRTSAPSAVLTATVLVSTPAAR